MYHILIRKPKQLQSSLIRRVKSRAKRSIRTQSKQNQFGAVLDACRDVITDLNGQSAIEGLGLRWSIVISTPGHAITPKRATQVKKGRKHTFVLQLNTNYGQRRSKPEWKDYVVLAPSLIPGAGYGAFAGRRFEAGDTVGWYMGQPPPDNSTDLKHEDFPYLLKGVADGVGGIDSDAPLLLGMHFINDPMFHHNNEGIVSTVPASAIPANVQFYSDGRVVAIKRIYPGDELLAYYNTNND